MTPPLFLEAGARLTALRPLLLPVALGAAAVYVLLPRPRGYPRLLGAVLGALALLSAGFSLVYGGVAPLETVLFCAFSGIALVAGGMLISLKNPAHAALSFALVVLSTSGLFLLQGAPFLMAATIIIYAGAIIVTFLFVLMLAQQEGPTDADYRSREPLLATAAGFVLVGTLLLVTRMNADQEQLDRLVTRASRAAQGESAASIRQVLGDRDRFLADFRSQLPAISDARQRQEVELQLNNLEVEWDENADRLRYTLGELVRATYRGSNRAVVSLPPLVSQVRSEFSVPTGQDGENVAPLGLTLFSDYLLAVEISGILLLVATIGAIVITARRGEARPS